MKKTTFSSGAKWETIAGYSRAVRVGNVIEVAGTTAISEGVIVGKDNMYLQTQTILNIIVNAVEALGGQKEDIVRTRMYITDIDRWEEAAKAHGDCFYSINPASTMVEVKRLIDPDLLIEIEASAIIHS